MQTTYTVFRVDGTSTDYTVDLPEDPGYDRIKGLVQPLISSLTLSGPYSWFEHVTVLFRDERCDMFVDEHGLSKQLPRNDAATVVYRNNWLTRYPEKDPELLPSIRGDAVLFHRRIWF